MTPTDLMRMVPTQAEMLRRENTQGGLQTQAKAPMQSWAPGITTNQVPMMAQPVAGAQGQNMYWPNFDAAYYMSQNPDVAKAVQSGMFSSPYQHYQLHGQSEGRLPYATPGGGQTPQMQYSGGLDRVKGRALKAQPVPNMYQQRSGQGASPWYTGTPFGGQYGALAQLPMMSFLQSSPFASLYGFGQQTPGLMAQQAQPGFQLAPGATSGPQQGAPTSAAAYPAPAWATQQAYSPGSAAPGQFNWSQWVSGPGNTQTVAPGSYVNHLANPWVNEPFMTPGLRDKRLAQVERYGRQGSGLLQV